MKAFFAPFLAAFRTSEFWVFLGQVFVQVSSAPVPTEAKVAGWVYIGARIIGKVMQYVFPNPNNPQGGFFKNDSTPPPAVAFLAPLFLLSLFLASPGRAQEAVSLTDVGQRFHVAVNGGATVYTQGNDWSGASLGGALGYNLHPKLSAFVGYDHGFPVNSQDEHINLWRAIGNLRLTPNAFVGFGYAWFDKHTEGGVAQLAIVKNVMPKADLAGAYAHIFSRGDQADFEYVKVCVNYHLFGGK